MTFVVGKEEDGIKTAIIFSLALLFRDTECLCIAQSHDGWCGRTALTLLQPHYVRKTTQELL